MKLLQTLLNLVNNASSKSKRIAKLRPRTLGSETLERREVFDASFTWTSPGTLEIRMLSADERLWVDADSTGHLQISVLKGNTLLQDKLPKVETPKNLMIYGSEGKDEINVQTTESLPFPVNVKIYGNGGDDWMRIYGNVNSALMDGGSGNDIITPSIGSGGNVTVRGGADNDIIITGGEPVTTSLGVGNYQTVIPTNMYIYGDAGDDVVRNHQEVITNSDGSYYLKSQNDRPIASNTVIDGGEGNDILNSGPENSTIYGGAGNDLIQDGGGLNTIYGGADIDTIYGGNQADTIFGDSGNDIIYGNGGNDTLFGNLGDDRLYGGDGLDTLYGDRPSATATSPKDGGNDYLDGGSDSFVDKLYGDEGKDTFFLDPWAGAADSVMDFYSKDDRKMFA